MLAWTAAGVGVASLIAGGVLWGLAADAIYDANDQDALRKFDDRDASVARSEDLVMASYGAFSVAGASGLTALVLWAVE